MTCQHCENAPCEQVCPVGATVHTPEGLNTMVYNRCVGTRYCSNNCPYKVRRFNFLLYSDYETESLQADAQSRRHGAHPRRDGEVQLLRAAHHRGQDRSRQGEPRDPRRRNCYRLPAGLPHRAIIFGNINDKTSKVAKLKKQQRKYQVMADQNTRPRTTYLAEVFNPNPELAEAPVEHTPAKG